MTADNQAQIEAWNTEVGRRWTEEQDYLDRLLSGFETEVLRRAAVRPGETVIDIGCGCGVSSLALGAAVGAGGAVLGVDVSAPMLARARERATADGAGNVSFHKGDASVASLPAGRDLLFSRFGVMFFADPVAAFTHMRAALKPGGRMAFACWRAVPENQWMLIPLIAAIRALGATPAPSDPHAPGPFAFADSMRLRNILSDAGFTDIVIEPFDAPMHVGDTAADAASHSVRIGPVGFVLRDSDDADRARAMAEVTEALAEHATPQGVVLSGATWMVTARSV